MKKKKILIIILIIIVIIAAGLKIAYDYALPKIMDSVIEQNIGKILQGDLDKIDGILNSRNEQEEVEILTPKPDEAEVPSITGDESAAVPTPKKSQNYSVVQLEAAYKKASQSDKSTIFGIAKSCVPASEIPTLIDLYKKSPQDAMQYGMKFVTAQAKSEVLGILSKYLE